MLSPYLFKRPFNIDDGERYIVKLISIKKQLKNHEVESIEIMEYIETSQNDILITTPYPTNAKTFGSHETLNNYLKNVDLGEISSYEIKKVSDLCDPVYTIEYEDLTLTVDAYQEWIDKETELGSEHYYYRINSVDKHKNRFKDKDEAQHYLNKVKSEIIHSYQDNMIKLYKIQLP